ncbi:GreA/GreB family elongation factor [Microvirga massiliensis]|uniref:GreA/GreB family elongation factor n=1 Tax=Microvirga massiliensis TaxID=1033741 RepID=UPI00062B78D3|nr:GreA/GreB family elongation factor [Microvirga massiliensis]
MRENHDIPTISSTDYARLAGIATRGLRYRRIPPTARLLAGELGRANVIRASELPDDVVSMHSVVEFKDGITDQVRRATLVYPGEEDGDSGRISVLSLLGTALIGMAAGQSVRWHSATHGWRTLRVIRVISEKERREPS